MGLPKIIKSRAVIFISLAINIVAILFVIIHFYKVHQDKVNHPLGYLFNRQELYKLLPIDTAAVVFMGDSQVQKFDLDELLKKTNLINRGIDGDFNKAIYNRLSDVTRWKPKKLFIEAGTNDVYIGIPLDTSMAYMKKIILSVKKDSPTTQLFVQSIFPRDKGLKDEVINYNAALKQLCATNNVTYINAYDQFSDNGVLNPAFDCGDNLHLSGKGYLQWSAILKPYL